MGGGNSKPADSKEKQQTETIVNSSSKPASSSSGSGSSSGSTKSSSGSSGGSSSTYTDSGSSGGNITIELPDTSNNNGFITLSTISTSPSGLFRPPFRNMRNAIAPNGYIYYDKQYTDLVVNPSNSVNLWDAKGNKTSNQVGKFVFVPFLFDDSRRTGNYASSSTLGFLAGIDHRYGRSAELACNAKATGWTSNMGNYILAGVAGQHRLYEGMYKYATGWFAWRLGNQDYTSSYHDNKHQWSSRLGGMNTSHKNNLDWEEPTDLELLYGCYWNKDPTRRNYGNIPRLRNETLLMYKITGKDNFNSYDKTAITFSCGGESCKIGSDVDVAMGTCDSEYNCWNIQVSPKVRMLTNNNPKNIIFDGKTNIDRLDSLLQLGIIKLNLGGTNITSMNGLIQAIGNSIVNKASNLYGKETNSANIDMLIETWKLAKGLTEQPNFNIVKPTQTKYNSFTLKNRVLDAKFRGTNTNFEIKNYEIYSDDYNPNYYKYLRANVSADKYPFINFIVNFLNSSNTFSLGDPNTYLSATWINKLNTLFNFNGGNGNAVLLGLPEIKTDRMDSYKRHVLLKFNNVCQKLMEYSFETNTSAKTRKLNDAKLELMEMFENVNNHISIEEAIGSLFIPCLLDLILSKSNSKQTSFDKIGKLIAKWSNGENVRFSPSNDANWKGDFSGTGSEKGFLSNDAKTFCFNGYMPNGSSVPYENIIPTTKSRNNEFYGSYAKVEDTNNYPYIEDGLMNKGVREMKQKSQQFARMNVCKNLSYTPIDVMGQLEYTMEVPLNIARYGSVYNWNYRNGVKTSVADTVPCCCSQSENAQGLVQRDGSNGLVGSKDGNQPGTKTKCPFDKSTWEIAGSPMFNYRYIRVMWNNIWDDLYYSLATMHEELIDKQGIIFGKTENYEHPDKVNQLRARTQRIPPCLKSQGNELIINKPIVDVCPGYSEDVADYYFSSKEKFSKPNIQINTVYQANAASGSTCYSAGHRCEVCSQNDKFQQWKTELYLPKDELVNTGMTFATMMQSAFNRDKLPTGSSYASDYYPAYLDTLASNGTIKGYSYSGADDCQNLKISINGELLAPISFNYLDPTKQDKNVVGDKCPWTMEKDTYFISKYVVEAWLEILTNGMVLEWLLGELCEAISNSKDCLALYMLDKKFKTLIKNTWYNANSQVLYNVPIGPGLMFNTDSLILGNSYFHGEYAFSNNALNNGNIDGKTRNKDVDAKQIRNVRVTGSMSKTYVSNNYLDMLSNDATETFAVRTDLANDAANDVCIVVQIPNSASEFLAIPRMSYDIRANPFVFITRCVKRGGFEDLYESASTFAAENACILFSTKGKAEYGDISGIGLEEIGATYIPRLRIENLSDNKNCYRFNLDERMFYVMYSRKTKDNISNIDVASMNVGDSNQFAGQIKVEYSSSLTEKIEFLKNDVNERIKNTDSWWNESGLDLSKASSSENKSNENKSSETTSSEAQPVESYPRCRRRRV